ncbi:MAG: DNA-formamidopyrimidine glycosylase family protein [Bacteroidota bacterium]|nr:DNA-formamidopyrimidine glycosylase family protein [Bacteroidota bacterium]
MKQLESFKGHRASSTHRIGKYCFLGSGNERWLVFHFGMTGYVDYFEKEEDKPEYAAFTLVLKGKGMLSYVTKRKLGKVEICKSPDTYARDNKLGVDALECSKPEFLKLLGRKKGSVKATLMDQSLISGIGNIYSDEILFHSGIHPKASMKDISEQKREIIYKKMKEVLKKAIEVGAVPDRFPKSYLLKAREEGKACPVCKKKISKISVSGRSTYYCPSCQKK